MSDGGALARAWHWVDVMDRATTMAQNRGQLPDGRIVAIMAAAYALIAVAERLPEPGGEQ